MSGLVSTDRVKVHIVNWGAKFGMVRLIGRRDDVAEFVKLHGIRLEDPLGVMDRHDPVQVYGWQEKLP